MHRRKFSKSHVSRGFGRALAKLGPYSTILVGSALYVLTLLVKLRAAFTLPILVVDDEDLYTRAGLGYVSNIVHPGLNSSAFSINPEHPAFAKLIFGFFASILSFLDFSTLPCARDCVTNYATFDMVLKARIGAAVVTSLGPVMLFLFVRDITDDDSKALTSAFFLGTFPYIINYSSYSSLAYLDQICATLLIGSLFWFCRSQKSGRQLDYALSGLLAGLSVASKYYGILAFPIIGLFYLFKVLSRDSDLRKQLRGVGLLLLAAGVAFYLADPIIWGRPDILVWSFAYHCCVLGMGGQGGFGIDSTTFIFITQWGLLDATPFVLLFGAMLGLAHAFVQLILRMGRGKMKGSGVVMFLIYFMVTLSFLSALHRKSPHYFTAVVPSLAALGGIGIGQFSRYLSKMLGGTVSRVKAVTDIIWLGMLFLYFYFEINSLLVFTVFLGAYLLVRGNHRQGRAVLFTTN